MLKKMARNRKIPLTKRVLYEEEDSADELDAGDIQLSIPDSAKPSINRIEANSESLKLSCSSKILRCCCCGECCWKVTESLNKDNYPHPFRFFDLMATIGSLVIFFYDVVSDILLARSYYVNERWTAFGFTVAFIAFPLIVVNLTSLRWYHIDFLKERDGRGHTSCGIWFFRVLFTFPLMLGPVVRHIEYIYHGFQSRSSRLKNEERRKHHYTMMLHEDTDAGMMRMFESFLESAPQLVLQLYIILTESQDEGYLMSIIRPIAMVGSLVGVSWSLVSYHKALRASHNEMESGLTIIGSIFYYLWRACEVGPRMLVLALFASKFSYGMLIVVGVHWIVMFVWTTIQKPEFYKNTVDKVMFNVLIGFVMVFCFQNVKNGPTRYRALVYYLILYAENLAMLGAWVYSTDAKSEWYYFTSIAVIPGGIVLHICVQLIYYRCFHPNRHEIPCCLNLKTRYTCYQYVCDEIEMESKPDSGTNGKTFDV